MDEYESIFKNIKKIVEITSDDEQEFSSYLRKVRIKKKQLIVQPGFTCTHQTYVVKGAFKSYFVNNDGVEYTIQFAIDDWFISDFNSYITQTPASLFVEAFEDSIILQIEYNDEEKLCSNNPKFERFFRIVAQKSFAFAQRRILSNIGKTAEERYIEFNSMYPSIVQRVPQYALASYLGMTPEFLSKIRKKLTLKS